MKTTTKKSQTGYKVTCRERKLKDGRISLYLDIYENGKRSYEFLGLYIYPEIGINKQTIKNANQETRIAVDKMLCERRAEFADKAAGIAVKRRYSREKVTDVFKVYMQEKAEQSRNINMKKSTLKSLESFRPEAKIKDLDKDFCKAYIQHLRTYRCATSYVISQNTARNYYVNFAAFLNWLVRNDYIAVNPSTKLSADEKIKPDTSREREYLTEDELSRLAKTPCKHQTVKQAFMFSVYTGLRISDIMNLSWSDFFEDNGLTKVKVVMKKTAKPIECVISKAAKKYLPERTGDDKVFGEIPEHSTVNRCITRWMNAAGVNKHISFHCARHTFATTALTAGVDLYTVSQMLGHSKVSTTQIYAKIVDKKKEEAARKLAAYLGKKGV